jgi:hypothetical protein
MKYKFNVIVLVFLFSFFSNLLGQEKINLFEKKLDVKFKGDSQIEVGSPYVGIEMHHGSFLPERISFYYPVANSIDMSTDYFKRDTSFVIALGLKIGVGKKQWLGLEPVSYILNPYSVKFNDDNKERVIKISYEFCKTKPAMVIKFQITNKSKEAKQFEFYTHLETSLKTSHTYALVNKAWTEYDRKSGTIYCNFDNEGTKNAEVFVSNAALMPVSFSTVGSMCYSSNPPNDNWLKNGTLEEKVFSKKHFGIPAAIFLYRENLKPGQTMTVVQIIGSSKQSEGNKIVSYLRGNYQSEINEYSNYIMDKVNEGFFKTKDQVLDYSYLWAKAILTVDRHYIDGQIRPMPCPAEYNFYFTHDVLLTDLAAVNFDLPRVKADLLYTIGHANSDYVIPHAYYWKDSAFITEYAESDNWNHFWFIIASASYLRHSNDISTVQKLFPYLSKSLNLSLQNRKEELIWEYRPDWWDIGHNYGPRAYTTILEINALRDYIYLASTLHENPNILTNLEVIADSLNKSLINKLWDKKLGYLMNYYNEGDEDTHYYIGPLIAAHFNLLTKNLIDRLVMTAKEKLLDPKLGIYNVFPMDFEKLDSIWKFVDTEEGAPFYYINGGIWPHGNSWYSLALIAENKRGEAYKFIKKIMTIDGIMHSPNGQPAMYEVRIGDYHHPEVYGKIDKPEFMWAGAWYIYTLYHLFGIKENNWNIQLSPYIKDKNHQVNFTLDAEGKQLNVNISGQGNFVKNIEYNGTLIPSLIVPLNIKKKSKVKLVLGHVASPYINFSDAILTLCSYSKNKEELNFYLRSFAGHKNKTEIISPKKPIRIFLNEKQIKNWNVVQNENLYITNIEAAQDREIDKFKVEF